MPPALSLYLDVVRFTAAFGVLLSHMALSPFTDHAFWWALGQYGDAAVAVFFVLSGYVIAFVTAERETDGWRYGVGRLSRLMSVALPALVITALCDAFGAMVRPDFYARPDVGGPAGIGSGYLASLLFINEWQVFGFGAMFPGSNSPWWSLSFEATYYVVGGLFLYFRRSGWFLLALLILMLAGRTVIAMFPLWLLGFHLFSRPPAWPFSARVTTMLFWASLLALIWLPLADRYLPSSKLWFYMPWGRGPYNRDLVSDYLVAASFGLHLLAARRLLQEGAADTWQRWQGGIRWLGSLTFPLYLCHYPLLCLVAALSPFDHASLLHVALLVAVTLLVVAGVAPWSDRLKLGLRSGLQRLKPTG